MDYFLTHYPFKNTPFTHQAAYLQRFWEDREVAVLAEMGTGKSFMLINNAAMEPVQVTRPIDRAKFQALEGPKLSEAELQRVKTQWVASEVYKLDSVFNQARELGVAWALGLPPDSGAQVIARLRQVTAAQVQAVARKYFGDDALTVAILRPQPLSAASQPRRPAPGARH